MYLQSALLYHFGLNDDLRNVPGSRLMPASWKDEFSLRYELAQKWCRSKVPSITHDPRIGNISMMNADMALRRIEPVSQPSKIKDNAHGSAPSMLSLSLTRGCACRSDPYNGKVAKGGMMQGAPEGFGFVADLVTAAAVSKDGATILWGMSNGSVHVSRTGLTGRFVHGQGQRAAAPTQLSKTHENHMGLVTAVSFLASSETVVTYGSDGTVKLWDCSSGILWSSQPIQSMDGRPDEAVMVRVSSNMSSIAVVCGTKLGTVHLWSIDAKTWQTSEYRSTPGEGAVDQLMLDGSAVLLHHEGDEHFYRLSAEGKQEYGHFEGYISEITAIGADFQRAEQVKPSASITIDGKIVTEVQSDGPASLDFGRMAFVVAGDDQGRTFLWNWDSEHCQGVIKPIRRLQGFETKVTSIDITQLVILLGS